MTNTIPTLLAKARQALVASDNRLQEAAEFIAKAKLKGATQDKIARALGRSPAYVSLLLRWRHGGFKGTPFGPQSRAARQAVQARAAFTRVNVEHTAESPRAAAAPDQMASAPRAEAQRGLIELQRLKAQAAIAMFGATISPSLRAQLVAALAALPATHPAERVRKRLGLQWDELIVAASADAAEQSEHSRAA